MCAALGLAATACGSATASPSATPSPRSSASPDALSGASLTVLAAASLSEAFDDATPRLGARHPGLAVTYSFAGSQTLVTQLVNGAPADVVATADATTMETLLAAGIVDAPRTLARNRLEIAVAPGNPKHVTGLRDLARPDLRVVLEDPSVPAGRYGRQALAAQHVSVTPVSEPLDVKSELLAVEQGNADAGIVYVTDVASAGASVGGVTIRSDQNIVATYPIAVVRRTRSHAAAAAYVTDATQGTVHDALMARGFLPP